MKHKRDSWQTWENYAQVAARVGQGQTAVRALQQVLGLSAGQRLDLAVLSALVGQVEAARRGEGSSTAAAAEGGEQQQQPSAAASGGDAAPAAEGAAPAAGAAAAAEGGSELAELASALGELSTGGPGNPLADPEAVQRAEARAQEVLEQSVGGLMKQVAATVSGDSAFWEVYARCGLLKAGGRGRACSWPVLVSSEHGSTKLAGSCSQSCEGSAAASAGCMMLHLHRACLPPPASDETPSVLHAERRGPPQAAPCAHL